MGLDRFGDGEKDLIAWYSPHLSEFEGEVT